MVEVGRMGSPLWVTAVADEAVWELLTSPPLRDIRIEWGGPILLKPLLIPLKHVSSSVPSTYHALRVGLHLPTSTP